MTQSPVHVRQLRLCTDMETREPGISITYGFSNRWYFRGSISSSGSSFTGLRGASSGMTAGGLCGEKSSSKVEGCDRERMGEVCVCVCVCVCGWGGQ